MYIYIFIHVYIYIQCLVLVCTCGAGFFTVFSPIGLSSLLHGPSCNSGFGLRMSRTSRTSHNSFKRDVKMFI